MSCPEHNPPVCPTPDPSFKMEAVVVCDRYHDFLRCTLPTNKFLFDKIVVVTSAEDKETQRICEFHHVEVVTTDKLNSRWGTFCKGAGINEGLAKLSKSDWVVHLDADIWLPPQTRHLIQNACLDKSMIYGCDRFMVKGYKAWEKFLEMPVLQHEDFTWIHMHAFPIGTRVMHRHQGGWVPIGFFQLWNPGVSKIDLYPEGHTDASREDTHFACYWTRSERGFLPEVVAYHLASEDAGHGTNWAGRKTSPFRNTTENTGVNVQ